jgi:hypothetical protein
MNPRIPLPTVSDKDEKRNNRVQIHDSKITYWFIPPEIGALSIPLLKKNILGVVATFTRAGGECWATDTQLGEAFQWSRQKVNAAINEMVTAGLLRKDVTRLANGMTPRRLWIADSFPTLSPTVTTLATSHIDLVTHGDYPCHLEGLPLSPTVTTLVTHGDTNSNKLNKEKVTERVVADAPLPNETELKDSLIDLEPIKEPLEIHEAPPIPAAPPKAQKPKKPDLPIDAVDALEVPDEVKAAAKRWFEHKQLIKNPIKVRTLLREITKYGHGLPVVVQRSISSNYDGLWPIKYQDLDEVADEAVNKLFVCMSEDGDWVEAGRSNPLLRDSLTEYMGANGIDDKQTFKNKAEGSGRTFILKDIKKIYIRKMKQTFNTI